MIAIKRITVIAVALITFIVSCWLLLGYRLPGGTQFWQSLQNAGHAILFFVIAFIVCSLLHVSRYKRSPMLSALFALSASILFGGAVEIVQGFVGREPSWGDLWLDAQGAIAGICIFLVLFTKRVSRVVSLMLAGALIFNSLSLPIRWLIAEQQRALCFPVIADFENRWLTLFIDDRSKAKARVVATPEVWHNNVSGRVLQTVFGEGRWPSVVFFEPEPNWQGHSSFSFEVFNPADTPVKLSLRIDDTAYSNTYKDRFNTSIEVKPGYSKVSIPFSQIVALKSGRQMDMSSINQLILFTGRQKTPVTLYFDDFKLN